MRISGGGRFMAALGYPFFLLIPPVNMRRDSMCVQFHARQGGVLFGLWAVLSFILLLVLLGAGSGLLATIFIGVFFLITFLYIAMPLIGLLKVMLAGRYRMPVAPDVPLLLRL